MQIILAIMRLKYKNKMRFLKQIILNKILVNNIIKINII